MADIGGSPPVAEPGIESVPVQSGRSRGTKVGIIAAVVAGAVVLLAGAAVAFFVLTSGRGPQPETAMPADTIAFVKIDLDPSAGQKVNALRFLRANLPDDAGIDIDPEAEDPIGNALSSTGIFDNADFTWSDIDAWLGDRAAVAAVPNGPGEVAPALFVRVDDETAMTSFFARFAPDIAVAMVREGYAVIAEDQQIVDRIARSTRWLTDDSDFQQAMSALGAGRILSAWVSLPAAIAAQQSLSDLTGASLPSTEAADVQGSLAMGLAVEPDVLELLTVADGLVVDGETLPWMPPSDDLASLPGDVVAGVTMGNLGDYLGDVLALDSVREQVPDLEDEVAAQLGVSLDDVLAILSTSATVFAMESPEGLDAQPLVGVRLAETDTTTQAAVEGIVEAAGGREALRIEQGESGGNSYVQLSVQEQSDPFTALSRSTAGPLADDESFTKVVLGPAALTAYVDMSTLWDYVAAQSPGTETYRDITAAGLTWEMGSEDENVTSLRLRVAFDGN